MELPPADDCVIKMTEVPNDGVQLATVSDVNCHLICSVCKGYLVDATTITECLHSFCRSCVVPHVTEFHECPTCSVPLSSSKPFSQLRRDYTLQSIVYKLIPRLARNELERRKQFFQQRSDLPRVEFNKTEECYLQSFFAPNDPISMSLEYAEPNCEYGLKNNKFKLGGSENEKGSFNPHRRFLRCPANLPIGHLMKFLRCKFNIMDPERHKLEILYNGRPLAPDYKLSDVAYIFSWKEREPLRLWYRIHPSIIKEEEIKITADRPKTNPRATLVDITSKRQWNGKKEERCKRRRRSVKIQRHPSPDRPVKTIFDEESHGTAEFSCSTPIPSSAVVTSQDGESSNKKQNWLPKAVFDLDDRALFAQRLQRITNPPESDVKEEHVECDPVEQKAVVVDDDDPLTPLRICVSPEPSVDQPDDPVHDSIGALDLSGTSHKGDSSTDVSSPLSSGSCRSNGASPVSGGPAASRVGPHPYFMTPSAVYHHVQQQDPAQSMAALTAVAAAAQSESKATPSKVPIWDILQHIRPVEGASIKKSNSLLSLLKSSPILFRPNHNNNNNTIKSKTNKQSTTSPHSA